MPKLYKILGYAGALPFVFCAFALLRITQLHPLQTTAFYESESFLALTQLAYAGFIASFLAGVHWAHGLPKNKPLLILVAMAPTIIVLGLFLVALISGLLAWPLFIASIGFKALYWMDTKLLEPDWLPDDYFRFRLIITAVVCTSLFLSALSFWI